MKKIFGFGMVLCMLILMLASCGSPMSTLVKAVESGAISEADLKVLEVDGTENVNGFIGRSGSTRYEEYSEHNVFVDRIIANEIKLVGSDIKRTMTNSNSYTESTEEMSIEWNLKNDGSDKANTIIGEFRTGGSESHVFNQYGDLDQNDSGVTINSTTLTDEKIFKFEIADTSPFTSNPYGGNYFTSADIVISDSSVTDEEVEALVVKLNAYLMDFAKSVKANGYEIEA